MRKNRDIKDKNRLKRVCNENRTYKVIFANNTERKMRALDYCDLIYLLIRDFGRRRVFGRNIRKILLKSNDVWTVCVSPKEYERLFGKLS